MTLRDLRTASDRGRVVAEARTWLKTPFHHEARVKGAGVDCCQLLMAVYFSIGLIPVEHLAHYPKEWFLHTDQERVLAEITKFCRQVDEPLPADIVTFRIGRARAAHAGILAEMTPYPHMIHAHPRFGVTIDTLGKDHAYTDRISGWWRLRQWD